MTYSEDCDLNAEGVAVEGPCDCLCSRRSDGGRVDGNCNADSGEKEDRRSTWTSVVASFCTNPLRDSFVNTPEAKRDNGEAVRDLQRQSARAVATATSLARANCGSLLHE
ncbi:hypothetical protein CGC20_15315 [Leishmania donovani]|uniref:Uncharacterized protein n=1 Tax=Leishmania donovani TaxID=5661 RepID=A0A504XKZ9_LEIDO|nr:hypothetical protein CGC20_15315 [Leishmania donovani]